MNAVASTSSLQSILPPGPSTFAGCSAATTSNMKQQFAFAQIKGNVCLVQVSDCRQGGTASALMVSDVNIFRHEFITQFRFSHSATVHPSDLYIIEPIDEQCTLYEEEKGTVFLARDVMARMQRLTMNAYAGRPQSPCYHQGVSKPVSRLRCGS